MPGETKVSVKYAIHMEKYILLKSRDEIATAFKALQPDCPFKISVLKREFPPNAVRSTSRDFERNTCPLHANACCFVHMLHSKHAALNVPIACRKIAAMSLCSHHPGFYTLDPKT
jgi:hypothetical protein